MTIFLGADHGGFAAKEQLKEQLRQHGYTVEDCGAFRLDMQDDYSTFAEKVAFAVKDDPQSRGIVMCRSGHGMVITANKIPGIRAALATTEEQTVQSHEHDDTNVLAFGIDYMDQRQVLPLSLAWLQSRFLGGHHMRRLNAIADLEKHISGGE
jgi:ribose 5-phosphate isomerase B